MHTHIDLHDGHRERLRYRLVTEGIDDLEPHEILEFLLYFAIPRQDVNALAHDMLDHFGSLQNIFRAKEHELARINGMGDYAAHWLYLIGKISRFCGKVKPEGFISMKTAALVIRNMRELKVKPNAPCLMQLCLNKENALLYRRVICTSRNWGEPEFLREALSDVISTGTHHVVLVLFTENKKTIPIKYDLKKIQDYTHLLKIIDCVLLDFILIHKHNYYSLHRGGQLPRLKQSPRVRRMCEEYLSEFPDEPEADAYPISNFEGEKQ